MRILAKFSLIMLAAVLGEAEVNPPILRLIGPEARFIYGVDVTRFRGSILSEAVGGALPWGVSGDIRQMIRIDYGDERGPLTVFSGTAEAAKLEADTRLAVFDERTSVMGDAESVQTALRLWRSKAEPGEMAAKVRRLADSYDNWFVIVKPLARPNQLRPSKYRDDLVQAVEEVSGGIRFGPITEFRVEGVLKSADDAAAVAVLGKWLPGMLQLDHGGVEGMLVDAAENLAIHSSGRTVSMSFSMSEHRLQELMKDFRKQVRDIVVE